MSDTRGGNIYAADAALGFSENERALNRGLCVEREILWLPRGVWGVHRLGGGDVFGDDCRMHGNAVFAGHGDARMGLVDFLHHRAEQAGVIGQFALQNFRPEIDVSENAITRVSDQRVRRVREQSSGHRVPVFDRHQRHLFFAFEVMKVAALGHACRRANVIERGGCVALATDYLQRGVEQLGLGSVFGGKHLGGLSEVVRPPHV